MKKVLLLYGGMSTEHDVSLSSAKSILDNYDTNLFEITPVYVDKNNTPEQDEEIRLKVEKSLAELEEKAPQAFKDAYWFGIWKKKKRK